MRVQSCFVKPMKHSPAFKGLWKVESHIPVGTSGHAGVLSVFNMSLDDGPHSKALQTAFQKAHRLAKVDATLKPIQYCEDDPKKTESAEGRWVVYTGPEGAKTHAKIQQDIVSGQAMLNPSDGARIKKALFQHAHTNAHGTLVFYPLETAPKPGKNPFADYKGNRVIFKVNPQ